MTIDRITVRLETVLNPKRFKHSVRVMETSTELAKMYNINIEKAALAGLLHDCARDVKGNDIFVLCSEYGISYDFIGKSQPELLHGPIGAEIARVEYGINDGEILDAIRCHTTGRAGMSLLDKIVFIADYVEPGRNFPGVEEARKLAYKDINRSLLMALERTIRYVLDKGLYIHLNTVEARNHLLKEIIENR